MRELIIEELKNRGYNVQARDVVKNGVVQNGIEFISVNGINPVVYMDNVDNKLNEAVDLVLAAYEKGKNPKIEVNSLFDKNYILNNVYIGLQKRSNEKLIKRPFKDSGEIECYLYTIVDSLLNRGEKGSVKLSQEQLEKAGISDIDALWDKAEQNTFDETEIMPMCDVIRSIEGNDLDFELEDAQQENPMYVVSNKSRMLGAASILNRELLTQIAYAHKVSSLVVLPSSTHECLVIPYDGDKNMLENYSSMVAEVNATQVDETEQLANKAFLITF